MKFIVIIAIVFVSNCKREEPPIPTNNKNYTSLELVWRTMIADSNYYNTGIAPTINSNGDILISDDYNKATYNNSFKLYDGSTGKLKWEVLPFTSPQGSLYNHVNPIVINDK